MDTRSILFQGSGGALLKRLAGVGIQESSESSIFALSQSNDGNVMGLMGF